jgi:hypothetical protein
MAGICPRCGYDLSEHEATKGKKGKPMKGAGLMIVIGAKPKGMKSKKPTMKKK